MTRMLQISVTIIMSQQRHRSVLGNAGAGHPKIWFMLFSQEPLRILFLSKRIQMIYVKQIGSKSDKGEVFLGRGILVSFLPLRSWHP